MSKKKEAATPEVKALTEITVGDHTIPVVPTLDDLPRAARHLLQDVAEDSAVAQLFTNGPRFQAAIDYALAYANLQGVNINLGELEGTERSQTRAQLITSGFLLLGHFNKAADKDPKAEEESSETSEAEKSK